MWRLLLLAARAAAIWHARTSPSPSCSGPISDAPVADFAGTGLTVDLGRLGAGMRAGCFAYQSECRFDVEALDTLEFDVAVENCESVWAAPLWLEPEVRRGGALSGEIDLVENCPAGAFWANFAGKAPFLHQGQLRGFRGAEPKHIKMKYRRDLDTMIVFEGTGVDERLVSWYLGYAAHTNRDKGLFRLTSDIWTGYGGDDGFNYCTGARGPDPHSGCRYAVGNVRLRMLDGQRAFPEGSACSALESG